MTTRLVLLLDLAAEYPGDLLGESLIDLYPEILSQAIKNIESKYPSQQKTLRVSGESYRDKVNDLLEGDFNIVCEGQRISTYDPRSPLNHNKKIYRSFEIFQEMERISANTFLKHPISLWGNLPKLGHLWVEKEGTLTEIYQVDGGGQNKVGKVIINGPLGERFQWNEVREKRLTDFPYFVKTIHFFEEGDEVSLSRTWVEFFIEDSCKHCLPCFYKRRALNKDEVSFEMLEQYDCHLPELFQKGLAKGEVQ